MATTITIRARAEQGSDLAKLRLLIDGQEVATTSVSIAPQPLRRLRFG